MRPTPTRESVLRAAIAAALEDLHVCLPGKIVEYDSAKQMATVQPLLKRGYLDETEARKVERRPAITGVPVVFPGTGAFSITWKISAGDKVALFFSMNSLDLWLQRGDEVDPGDDRMHSMSDAIAVVGLRDFAHPIASPASGNHMTITAPEVRISGDTAADPVARKSDLQALYDAISNAVPVADNSGAGLQASIISLLDLALFPVCSSKVKVD